jgi:chemotaxis protein methyltransferase WspC
MTKIEQMLRERIGLDSTSIGSSLIQRTVRLRMKALGLKNADAYEEALLKSPAEWAELSEAVVVTETWFFRDREPFGALVRLVQEEWLPAHPTRPLRLLSVPCSSGEEPYSLIMALLDAGVPRERFQVDAVDISSRALAKASRGVYGKNSFRGKDLKFRERHFQQTKEGFVLNPALRSGANFIQGNILESEFLRGKGFYDFIFCRNLLIYFDRATQQRALARVAGLLAPLGVLFVGPAELPLVLEHGFVSANIPMAFACRRATVSTPALAKRPRPVKAVTIPPLVRTPFVTSGVQIAAAPVKHGTKQIPVGKGQESELEEAKRLADAGRLEEAASICESFLRRSQDSAHAYYLLGLVREAGGDATAVDCYRKALYLDPNHYETLLQMALLAEKNGDHERAQTFRRRAQRLSKRD